MGSWTRQRNRGDNVDESSEGRKDATNACCTLDAIQTGNADHSSMPKLRRAGSSTATMYSFDEERSYKSEEESSGYNQESSSSSNILEHVKNTLTLHLRGATKDFSKNGLPWKGDQCRSLMAGGSGILFMLPALVPKAPLLRKVIWIIQGFLSVMADYCHIHHDSVWHGIDRYFATANVLVTIYEGVCIIHPIISIPTAILPIACYIAANRAKQRLDLQAWHKCHFAWHISASLISVFAFYMTFHCPANQAVHIMEPFCLVEKQ